MAEIEESSEPAADVDWAYIEEELRDVPDEYKEQTRFYPLKHVVEIFSSGDPQYLTAELRDREARLSELVDMVVEGYHKGFTRSIQNYSQILALFQDARQQMDTMKRSIHDSIQQLGAHSRNLAPQWQRTQSLSTSLQLLKDVQAVVALPARITQAVAKRDWPGAVSLLLEACSRLSRDEMQQVGALRKLRSDLAVTCRTMQQQMCEELLALAYDQPRHPASLLSGTGTGTGTGGVRGRAQAKTGGPIRVALKGRLRRGRIASSSGAAIAPSSSGITTLTAPVSASEGVSRHPTEAGHTGHTQGGYSVDVEQLVACLASLDAVGQAKALLTYSARAQVRSLMWRAAESAATAASQSYHAVSSHREGTVGGGLGVPQHVEVLAQKLIQGVADVCMRVLASLETVLRAVSEAPPAQHSAALDMIRAQLAGGGDVRGATARPVGGVGGGGGKELSAAKREAYVRAEGVHVWTQMQEEWHTLLCQLLHSQLRALGSRGAQVVKKPRNVAVSILSQPLGWLQKIDEMGKHVSDKVEAALGGEVAPSSPPPTLTHTGTQGNQGDRGQGVTGDGTGTGGDKGGGVRNKPAARSLHFSLDVQVRSLSFGPGVWGGGVSGGVGSADSETAQGYARLVARALGEQQGNVYLTPAVYLPLSTFIDAALTIMKPYLQPVPGAGGARARRMAEQSESAQWLREGLEDFVLETFLPQIWMDLRARCTTALEHPDAFRPPAQALLLADTGSTLPGSAPVAAQLAARGTSIASFVAGSGGRGGAGRGVVPAARFAERLLQDIGSWSMAMPAFESSFMGVGENILGRMLDSFWTTLCSLASAYPSFRLALRYDVALSQVIELDSALLGGSACFCVPRPSGNHTSQGNTQTLVPGVFEVDVPAFVHAIDTGNRPELVPTVTGRTGLSSVASHQCTDLFQGTQIGTNLGTHTGAGSDAQTGTEGQPVPKPQRSSTSASHRGADTHAHSVGVRGLEAELELNLLMFVERPDTADQLMTRGTSSTGRLVSIAALGESLDFIADCIMRAAAKQVRGRRDAAAGARGGAARTRFGQRFGRGGRGGVLARESVSRATQQEEALIASLPDSLQHLVQRCKALAGLCVRTIRIELQLHVARALHELGQVPHLVETSEEARELPSPVSSLTRSLSRVCEDLSRHLSPGRTSYVMSGLAPAAARMTMWLLPEIREINNLGVDRMMRSLSALQPALIALSPSLAPVGAAESYDGDMRLVRMRGYDRARGYYQLLTVTVEEVVRLATERPMRLGYGEWMALVQVHVPGRVSNESHITSLQSVLDKAHGLTAGQKLVGAVGTVLTTVITAPELVADVALDVLKLGAGGLVAGARQIGTLAGEHVPGAKQLGKVFRKLEAVARDVTDKVKGTP